jgi:uncharacterized membrane protein YccF (DUF307 family)
VKTLGNLIWFVLAGFWMACLYVVCGALLCITVIGFPLGLQAFKLAGYALWPFGRTVVDRPGARGSTVGNVLWVVLAGLWLALGHVITGALLCITVIGIPFGLASFRMAGFAFWPFGKEVVSAKSAAAMA